jgi:integrase/recombinase XerD
MSLELEALIEFLTGSKMSAEAMPWWLLRAEDVRVIRSWANETLPAAAQRSLLRALRGILRSSAPVEDDLTFKPPVQELVRVTRRRRVQSRGMAPREAKTLLEMCRESGDGVGLRDAAIFSLMLLAGLRRQEVVNLQIGDYDDDDGRLIVRSARRQVRSVILMGECRDDIEAWLEHRGGFSGALFVRFDALGEVVPVGLKASAVNRLLAVRCQAAGGLRVTPRDLRGRFLWQMQLAVRHDERPPCRYYQDENGQPAWTLASMPSV